jgi:hypothetical protein
MFGNKKQRAANLMESGKHAVGTVLSVRDTGITVNTIEIRVAMNFRLDPTDGSPSFEAQKTTLVSRTSIPQPGQRYPIWYDADDPNEFAYGTIDSTADPAVTAAARQQIISIFGDAFGADASGVGLPATAVPAPAPVDPLDRIAKLEQLRQSGALTDEEFTAQKQKLLAEI